MAKSITTTTFLTELDHRAYKVRSALNRMLEEMIDSKADLEGVIAYAKNGVDKPLDAAGLNSTKEMAKYQKVVVDLEIMIERYRSERFGQ